MWYFELLRIRQWYKNLVVFIALVFSLNFFDGQKLFTTLIAFFSLLQLSSGNYIINDIIDKKRDRNHPAKRKRPLASNKISAKAALAVTTVLLVSGLWLATLINIEYLALSIVFLMIGVLYTLVMKNIFLADTITIAINFVLRAILGAIAINVVFSSWLIVCTYLLAMTLAFGKRKAELCNGYKHYRGVLKYYSPDLLNNLSLMSITSLFISYAIYTISQPHSAYMPLTLPMATFLLFRYMSFFYSNDNIIEHSENLLKDRQIVLGSALWVIAVMIILYFL